MTALRGRTKPYGGRSLRVALAWFFSSKPAYAIIFIGGPGSCAIVGRKQRLGARCGRKGRPGAQKEFSVAPAPEPAYFCVPF